MIYKYVSESRYKSILPENATNGDVIKAIFPNVEIARIQANCVIIWIDKPWIKCEISNHWWNAPYKAESEDKEGANDKKI